MRERNNICQGFASATALSVTYILELEKFNAGDDIIAFLKFKFKEIHRLWPRLFKEMQGEWPASQQLSALARKSEWLFIFTATIVYFVMDGKGSPQEKLNQVLDSHLGLNPLYSQILSDAHCDD